MNQLIVVLTVSLFALPALAAKSCDELKGEVEAKLKDHGVKTYTLDIVGSDEVKDQKVVGSCEGGKKKIVYKKS